MRGGLGRISCECVWDFQALFKYFLNNFEKVKIISTIRFPRTHLRNNFDFIMEREGSRLLSWKDGIRRDQKGKPFVFY